MNWRDFTAGGTALTGVLAGALVLSASYAQTAHAFDCTQPKHHCIKVTVDASTNTLSVDADPLRKKGPGHHLHWIVDNDPGQSYTFPSNGIAFSNGDGGAQEFTNCKLDPNDAHVFHCDDPKGARGTYKYTVTVSGNPKPGALDPKIINN